ncbi:hypothetical protein CEXT_570141 [Caerostris extrusa]|uniref:Uncharacterized protein n=1 Tax=Caerostris extrusa TaxID=172846 RepID=A0AAV4RUM2_CAEEX|nr:hypothetical protein CEXT_570141 [Caerostris extrusa]
MQSQTTAWNQLFKTPATIKRTRCIKTEQQQRSAICSVSSTIKADISGNIPKMKLFSEMPPNEHGCVVLVVCIWDALKVWE